MVGLLGLEPTDNHNGRSNVKQQQPEPKREGKGHSDQNIIIIFLILILGGAGGRNYTSWLKCHPQHLQNCHIGSHHFENPEIENDLI